MDGWMDAWNGWMDGLDGLDGLDGWVGISLKCLFRGCTCPQIFCKHIFSAKNMYFLENWKLTCYNKKIVLKTIPGDLQ